MSDYRRYPSNPNKPPNGMGDGKNAQIPRYQTDPFAPYDDPAAVPAPFPPQEDYSAWRRPPSDRGPSFLMDDPVPYGAEMLQGGVPLITQPGAVNPNPNFSLRGEDAPTRTGAPSMASQMVHKRKTIDRGERSPFVPPPLPLNEGADAFQETAVPPPVPDRMLTPAAGFSQPESGDPSPQQRNRRAARAARYQEPEVSDMPAPSSAAQAAPHAMAPSWKQKESSAAPGMDAPASLTQMDHSQGFDPFAAGDSESPKQALPRAPRRPAAPGERYSGPRTAMPASGAPIHRSRVGTLPEEDDSLMDADARQSYGRTRPAPPSRLEEDSRQRPPSGAAGQGLRPRPQGGPGSPDPRIEPGMPTGGERPPRPAGAPSPRPLQGMPGPRPRRPEGPEDLPPDRRPARDRDGMPRKPGNRPPASYEQDSDRLSSAASVRRPRYDFEEEEDYIPRRHGCLMPIVVILLISGIALAGICLPDWTAMGGNIGTALDGVKTSLTNLLGQAKEMVFPTEVRISEFAVNPAEGTAPVNLAFQIRTSKSVSQLRIADEAGNVYFEKALTDQDALSGIVTKNTNDLIWKLDYTMEQAFSGLLIVQTQLPDGSWDEGKPLASPLVIEMPAEIPPAVTSFGSDISQGTTPAAIHFTLQTSSDVEAVRLVNDYDNAVASLKREEGATQQGSVIQSGDGLLWELIVNVEDPYEGSYELQYQTPFEPGFIPSEFSKYVEMSQPLEDGEANVSGNEEGIDAAAGDNGEDPENAGLFEGDPGFDEAAGDNGDNPADAGLLEGDMEEDPHLASDGDMDDIPDPFPQETPTPTPELEPEPTPLPPLAAKADESASPSAIRLNSTVYDELKITSSYNRAQPLSMLSPFSYHLNTQPDMHSSSNYAIWKQSGVLTFRSGPLRQNAAYGALENSPMSLSPHWQVPVGSMKLSNSTVYGIVWPGQPAIVKWYTEARNIMNLNEEKKATTALKEVILGGQDGKIYFLDLADGEPTRDAIDMGAPIGGGVSVATNGTPILGVGQNYSKLATRQAPNGYHLFNLTNGKELLLLDGRDKSANSNFSGANGAALFARQAQREFPENKIPPLAMVVGGQNGVLYTVELNDHNNREAGTLQISPAIQRYKTLAEKQERKTTNIEASVAMYNNYIYYADIFGVLQCVDINTLSPVWAVKTGDSVLSTPALDFEEATQGIALYTGNTINRQGKNGVCTIRRYNALTGAEDWAYEVPELHFDKNANIGCVASPVVGQQSILDLVIFTVTDGSHGSRVIAIAKADGNVVWTKTLDTESQSSPVAVYDEEGGAWLIQAESNGNLHLMDARTGEMIHTLKLEGFIEASPAVYKDILVIGTTGRDTSFIYGIKIK